MSNRKRKWTLLFVMLLMLCLPACSAGNKGPAKTLSQEDIRLLEQIGSDLKEIAPEKFGETVSAFSAEDAGKVYGLVGYCHTDGEGTSYLCESKDWDTTEKIELSGTNLQLTEGDRYHAYGILSVEEHDGHLHSHFAVIAVESY